jgi:hypothetical protein
VEKDLFPRQGSHTYIMGTISGPPTTSFGGHAFNRIPLDVTEIAFLSSDTVSSPLTSPSKGIDAT